MFQSTAFNDAKLLRTILTILCSGMHAREWIGPAVATYILSQIVEKNQSFSKLLESADWMILPVANPDGYEFSHTTDRLWRKTRSDHSGAGDEARWVFTESR